MTEDIVASAPITITIDPAELLKAYTGGNWGDEGPDGTIATEIMDHVSRIAWEDIKPLVAAQIVQYAKDRVAGQIADLVRATLDGEVTPTDKFGWKGKAQPLRKIIEEEVKAWAGGGRDPYNRNSPGHMAKFLHDEVERAMKAELKAVVDEQKVLVRERIAKVAADELAKQVMSR